MTGYAVDSDVLGVIQRSGFAAEVRSLGRLPVVITDSVWDELTIGASDQGAREATVREAQELLETIAGEPTVLQPETEETATLVKLQGEVATEHEGEHSILAFALHHPDVTPVLLDKRATLRAVEELRRRVLSLHGFLDILRTTAFLDRRPERSHRGSVPEIGPRLRRYGGRARLPDIVALTQRLCGRTGLSARRPTPARPQGLQAQAPCFVASDVPRMVPPPGRRTHALLSRSRPG